MSPNRFDATTTSKRSGLRTKCAAQDVDVELVGADPRIALRHRLEALVPVRHRDRDAVRLGRRGHVLRRRVARELEREFQDPVDALAREHRLLEHDLALGALEHPAADRRILALGVLADDDEVDVARLAIRERCRDARHEPARAEVHVLVEAAPELDQRTPQRDVVGHRGRPADGAIEDRVVRTERRRTSPRASSGRASRSNRNPRRTLATRTRCRTCARRLRGRRPLGTVSLPMPSPGMTAMRCAFIERTSTLATSHSTVKLTLDKTCIDHALDDPRRSPDRVDGRDRGTVGGGALERRRRTLVVVTGAALGVWALTANRSATSTSGPSPGPAAISPPAARTPRSVTRCTWRYSSRRPGSPSVTRLRGAGSRSSRWRSSSIARRASRRPASPRFIATTPITRCGQAAHSVHLVAVPAGRAAERRVVGRRPRLIHPADGEAPRCCLQ